MIKERRKHPRLRIPLEAEYLLAGAEEWRQGTIWTLGAGGAALLCDQQLELGTALDGLHFAGQQLADLVGELLTNTVPLALANAVDYPLLRGEYRGAPELGKLHRDLEHIAV